jgi:hypothetical protein
MSPRRTDAQRERQRLEAAERALAGEAQKDIAAHLGVSASQVSRDLALIEERWLSRAREDYAAYREKDLLHLGDLEADLWIRWQESKKPAERITQDKKEGPRASLTTTHTVTEPGEGNITHLAGVLACIHRRGRALRLREELRLLLQEAADADAARQRARMLASTPTPALVGELERRYGPLEAWLGLRCPHPRPDRGPLALLDEEGGRQG